MHVGARPRHAMCASPANVLKLSELIVVAYRECHYIDIWLIGAVVVMPALGCQLKAGSPKRRPVVQSISLGGWVNIGLTAG